MNGEIRDLLRGQGVDIVRFVDISRFPKEQTLGFEKAILFCIALTREYVLEIRNGKEIDYNKDEYLAKELKVEKLADCLADYICQKGFRAVSQSQESNLKNGYIEQAYIDPELRQGISFLPLKAIAWTGGLGFIGKSNLLVTEQYGSAFAMCAVLTDASITPEDFPTIESKCGSCDACVVNCPAKALHGNEWTIGSTRESIVDVSKCCCALMCMVHCPWTLRYAIGE